MINIIRLDGFQHTIVCQIPELSGLTKDQADNLHSNFILKPITIPKGNFYKCIITITFCFEIILNHQTFSGTQTKIVVHK
jgi:hypothetical protein